ncbi:helix-turn-helix transcriptional regulator [Streptomyces sp. R302]|uniref:helix-turn-helix domain-containing protein n=1 Tax=unclassified Streptomyces TaxID=2593676 RepID=UPI00145D904E|nr:helix-turn-helix transcriptional regulator [Streptomyces sp. R301]NML80688.1 helix-turn-helix transcriptional regulator [Streptomyces sp. R302]
MTILPPDANLDELPRELARLRREHRWSYDDLAARTGLSRRTLIEIEQGRTIGTIATWHALSHAFGIPLDGLFSVLCEGHTPPGATPGNSGTTP